jgi:ribosome-associated protein
MDSLQLARIMAQEALDTKGQALKILDLKKLTSFTDYFVVVTGTSDRHVQAIADRVSLKLKKEHHKLPLTFEGYAGGRWVLLDYGDAVLHIFLPEQREYYALDELWRDAPRVAVGSESKRASAPRVKRKKVSASRKSK